MALQCTDARLADLSFCMDIKGPVWAEFRAWEAATGAPIQCGSFWRWLDATYPNAQRTAARVAPVGGQLVQDRSAIAAAVSMAARSSSYVPPSPPLAVAAKVAPSATPFVSGAVMDAIRRRLNNEAQAKPTLPPSAATPSRAIDTAAIYRRLNGEPEAKTDETGAFDVYAFRQSQIRN